jgi:hypothetical protein
MRHGVASDQADKFVESFVQSVVYAGLGKSDGTRVTLYQRDTAFAREGSQADRFEQESNAESNLPAVLADAAPGFASAAGPVAVNTGTTPSVASEAAVPIALRQAWPINGGEIEFAIRTTEPLPASIYALVAKMAEVAEEMRGRLTSPVERVMSVPPTSGSPES